MKNIQKYDEIAGTIAFTIVTIGFFVALFI